jgi:dipeptidyl-peptidase-4
VVQVGIAGGPVIDWKLYEVMYTERYMDTPSENPEGYKLTNLTGYTDNLQGDLLIVHGAQDPVVVMQHSMLFLQACIRSNKFVDFFIYPAHEHNVGGSDRIHLAGLLSDYFIQRLSR